MNHPDGHIGVIHFFKNTIVRRRRLIKKLALLIVSFLIAGLSSEILLRVIDYNYSPMKIEAKKNNDWKWRDGLAFEDDHFVYDPYLIWAPKKNYSIFNSQGYRGEELGVKKEGEFRIFTIGDSNTLGWRGGKDAPNWPMYLENLFRESSDRVKVINAGVWGYSSFQGVRRFNEILHYQPDMVLISFGTNDAHQVTLSDAEYVSRDKKLALLSKSRLGTLVIAFFDKLRLLQKDNKQGKGALVPRVSLEEYKSNLNEIIRVSKEKNIKTVLLTRPYMGTPPDKLYWLNFAPEYNKSVIDVAEHNKVPVVDVSSYFSDKADYFMDDCHFTRLGHKIASALIYEKILPYLPMTLKKITLNDYIERTYNDFNKTKKIVPKEVDLILKNFYDDFIWTNGDGRIIDMRYDVKAEDKYLVLKTFGWNPLKNDLNKLGLKIVTNGSSLKFSHVKDNAFYFFLDKTFKEINEIQIISSTFVSKELGINDDARRLGIDVASIEIK